MVTVGFKAGDYLKNRFFQNLSGFDATRTKIEAGNRFFGAFLPYICSNFEKF